MRATLILFAVFVCTSVEVVFSQEYHPMLNNSAWLLYDWTSWGSPSEERVIERGVDVTIGQHTYQKFLDPFPSYDGYSELMHEVYLREDVAARKVYKMVNGVDRLLYDFSLENSNTIFQYGNTFTATVDYISVNGGSRKRITLTSVEEYCGEHLTQVWIEGVGSDKHPFYPDYSMFNVCSSSGGTIVRTRCSFQNGVHIFGNPDCVDSAELSVSDLDLNTRNISFAPNPFVSELSIQSDFAFNSASIKLFNSIGQLVREVNNQSGKVITLQRENLDRGLYFLQVLENGKMITTGKIMVD
jgi:hypothetical protein